MIRPGGDVYGELLLRQAAWHATLLHPFLYAVDLKRALSFGEAQRSFDWNPSKRRYRTETFCYGPRACPPYRSGPERKVPGRHGMSYTEEDWVDDEATSRRGFRRVKLQGADCKRQNIQMRDLCHPLNSCGAQPNRFRALYGAARAARLSGNREASRKYFAELLKVCERADQPGRAEVLEANKAVLGN